MLQGARWALDELEQVMPSRCQQGVVNWLKGAVLPTVDAEGRSGAVWFELAKRAARRRITKWSGEGRSLCMAVALACSHVVNGHGPQRLVEGVSNVDGKAQSAIGFTVVQAGKRSGLT